MIKLEGESKISKPLPEKVSGTILHVESSHASIKILKFIQEVNKRKKKEHQCEKMKVGSDSKHKVVHTFEPGEFLVAERISNKVWKKKFPP